MSSIRPWPRVWLYFAATIVAATLVASQTYLSMLHHGHDWWRLFLWQLGSWSFWALVAPAILLTGARAARSEDRNRWRALFLRIGWCLLLVSSHILVSDLVLIWLQPFRPVSTMGFASGLRYLVVPWTLVDVLVCWLLFFAGSVRATRVHNRELALRESRLETELARAQLEALRLKIQPHFLFNTLNSIAAMVRRRSNEQALEMVLGLSHLLRTSLDHSESQRVTLREELDFVRRYVELQVQRFSDRLHFEEEIDPGCSDFRVPSLILQPLVENAIRHGVSPLPGGGTVRLAASFRPEGGLKLTVEDDGAGLPSDFEEQGSLGVGLQSTRDRLRHLYGEEAHFEIRARSEGGVLAELLLPHETLPLAVGAESA